MSVGSIALARAARIWTARAARVVPRVPRHSLTSPVSNEANKQQITFPMPLTLST